MPKYSVSGAKIYLAFIVSVLSCSYNNSMMVVVVTQVNPVQVRMEKSMSD